MRRYRLTAWGVPAGAILALLAGLPPGPAGAQTPAPITPPYVDPVTGKQYTKYTHFHLPIKLDDRARASLQHVVLFVKAGQGPWQAEPPVSAQQQRFQYRVPQDGEYWFSVVTVDKLGRQTPPDVTRERPALMVVVDTQPPTVEVQTASLPGGQPCLRCLLKDPNPDYQSIKISYRTPEGAARPLDPVPGQPGLFRAPPPEACTGSLHVTAADLARNQVSRDVNLKDLTALGSGAPGVGAPASGLQQMSASPPAGGDLPTPGGMHTAAWPASLRGSNLAEGPNPQPASPETGPQGATLPTPEGKPGTPPRQVINTKHAAVDYRVDPVGPSGVGKVEVWLTADKGASWQRVGEDPDRRSPAEVDLPGEGLFGIRLVVTNGNGFGGRAPQANDPPHTWVEVDTTPPSAQLRDLEPTTVEGKLEIRWQVTDRNLTDGPINLYYATKREGPWLPIGKGLKNDGFYRWAFPHDAGNQFFVKLEAIDQAGNRTHCESLTPVVLDMTEPNAVVVGVNGITPTPPRGN
jgi:hypothetical protein